MTLTISYLFGKEAYQDLENLYISKSCFSSFANSASPSGQQVLAILFSEWVERFFGFLVDDNNKKVVDNSDNSIEFDHSWVSGFYISQARKTIKLAGNERYSITICKVCFRHPKSNDISIFDQVN